MKGTKKDNAQVHAIVFLVVVALAASVGGYFFAQNNSRSLVEKPKSQGDLPRSEEEKLDSFLQDAKGTQGAENTRPIQSHLVNTTGKIERSFDFPIYPIGDVHWMNGNKPCFRAARGRDCRVPAGLPITLEIDALKYPVALDNSSIFSRIVPTEFGGLTIKGARMMDSSMTRAMLKKAVNWSACEAIVLESVPADKSVLSPLDEMMELRALRLSNVTDIDVAWLSRQPFLFRVEKLFFSGFNAEPLVRQLGFKHDGNLLVLAIEDAGVSGGAISGLQNCRALSILIFGDKAVDDQKVRAITQIKSLSSVTIKATRLTESQIRILTDCPWLNSIYLSTKVYPSPEERVTIKRLDPRIQFDDRAF